MSSIFGLIRLVLLAVRVIGAVIWFVGMAQLAARGLNALAERFKTLPQDALSSPPKVEMRIDAIIGDITTAPTEAIVNAANSELWMGGGVAGAIKRAAGVEVERAAMAQGPISPGQAVVTSAGVLPHPINWVIHAATMGPDLQTSEDLVRQATANALAAAVQVGARSVALPAMGTGVGALPVAVAARVMVREAKRAEATEGNLDWIVFVLRDQAAWDAFDQELTGEAKPDPSSGGRTVTDQWRWPSGDGEELP